MIVVGVGVAAVDDDGGVERLRLGPGRAGPTVGRALLHFLSLESRVRACLCQSFGTRISVSNDGPIHIQVSFFVKAKVFIFVFIFFGIKLKVKFFNILFSKKIK